MTDDEQEVFVNLKFNGTQDIIDAFKNAIGVPNWAKTDGSDLKTIMAVYGDWLEEGAPEVYTITPDNAELLVRLKFKTVDAAWDYVMSRPPGEGHGLSEHEIAVVMNYVKPQKE